MSSRPMHAPWDDLLDAMNTDERVNTELLGRVLGRLVRGVKAGGSPVTRAEISRGSMLGRRRAISPATVSKAIGALSRQGLITPLDPKAGPTGGRPTAPVVLGGDRWAVIGINVEHRGAVDDGRGGLRSLTGVLTRLNGEEIARDELLLPDHPSEDDEKLLIEETINLVRSLQAKAAKDKGIHVPDEQLLGVGLAIPGPVLSNGDVILETRASTQERLALGARLAERLSMPSVPENDVHCRAISAFYQGKIARLDAVLIEVFDEGVGGALIADGRIYRGGGGQGMEVGHLMVEYPPPKPAIQDDQGPPRGFAAPCLCDDHAFGHVDTLATPARIRGELRVENLAEAARTPGLVNDDQDQEIFRLRREAVVFRRAGRALGRGLAAVVNLTNPSQLLLRLPTVLATAAPQTSGAQYLSAMEHALSHAFALGPQEARNGEPRLPVEAVDPDQVPHDGACAAATAVLHRFIEHAENRDGLCGPESAPQVKTTS